MYIKYLFMRFIIKTRKTIQNRRITNPFLFQARTTPSVCKETFVLETLSFYIFFIYFHFGAGGVVVSLRVSTITCNSEIKNTKYCIFLIFYLSPYNVLVKMDII